MRCRCDLRFKIIVAYCCAHAPYSEIEDRHVDYGHAEGQPWELVLDARNDSAQRLARARRRRDYILVDASMVPPMLWPSIKLIYYRLYSLLISGLIFIRTFLFNMINMWVR